jgi:heat-inducible transcriptional repressor
MSGETDQEKRRSEILAALIRQYISSGIPVGSKAVAEQLSEPLSTATIRNVMAELEAEGYLRQPHVSAGRVPTDKAYRFFVDRVAGSVSLGRATEKYIDLNLSTGTEPEQLMARISRVLAQASRQVGLVLGPALEEKLLEHIKFVKLPEGRVLAVIVSKPDLIENKVIRLEEEFAQEDLDSTANFLNAEFRGWSLRTIRLEIFKRMGEEKIAYDRLLKSVATLFMWGALADQEPGPLFVDGTAKFLEWSEFEDARKITALVATFEQKGKLVKILTACLDGSTSTSGVRILIGRENPESQMRHCTFVVAPFHYRDRRVGALGVAGPTRMEYERAITMVDYVAQLTSRLLSSN